MPKRKTVRHFHEPGHLHELTFSCYHQHKLLFSETACGYLARAIDHANQTFHIELVAYVFMPDHVHLLVRPMDPRPDLSRYLAAVKRPTSAAMRGVITNELPELAAKLRVPDGRGGWAFRFWQAGPGYDRNLWTEDSVLASITYIHNNPVRAGLCSQTIDWRWSSARQLEDPNSPKDPALPMVHGLA